MDLLRKQNMKMCSLLNFKLQVGVCYYSKRKIKLAVFGEIILLNTLT